jgi:hypothetical protein
MPKIARTDIGVDAKGKAFVGNFEPPLPALGIDFRHDNSRKLLIGL